MAKKIIKPEQELSVEQTSKAAESETSNKPESKTDRPIRATHMIITTPQGEIRDYSQFTHGIHWQVLANAFAERTGGKIIEK